MTTTQIFDSIRNETRYKACFRNDPSCSERVVRGHSIQNNKILSRLSVDGYVMTIELKGRVADYAPVGRRKASTFSGFCSFHDDALFKPIEAVDFSPDSDSQFVLFAYRALAIEYMKKQSSVRMYKRLLELLESRELQKRLRNCSDYHGLGDISESYRDFVALIAGTQIELSNMETVRGMFHSYLENNNNDFLESFVLCLGKEFPIAATSSITIERDFRGNVINDFQPSSPSRPLYLSIFPQAGETYVLFSFLGVHRKTYSDLRRDLRSLSSARLRIVLTQLLANHVENFYVSPVYWAKIDSDTRSTFLSQFESTMFSAGNDLSQPSTINVFV